MLGFQLLLKKNKQNDIEIIESELLLSDIERTENILEKLNKLIKVGKNEFKEDRDLFIKVLNSLQSDDTYKNSDYSSDELYTINKNGILPCPYSSNSSFGSKPKNCSHLSETQFLLSTKL